MSESVTMPTEAVRARQERANARLRTRGAISGPLR